jgi:hypothetical protein
MAVTAIAASIAVDTRVERITRILAASAVADQPP